jgi:hypothetical protein
MTRAGGATSTQVGYYRHELTHMYWYSG